MAIVTRAAKGSPLTTAEMDNNFTELDEHPDGLKMTAQSGEGIKLDPSSPQFGWHDLRAFLTRDTEAPGTFPPMNAFRGGIKQLQFTVTDTQSAFAAFHIPHDYVPGTDLFIHVHWCHNSATVTGGSVTWGFEASYAKGHQQEAFSSPILVPVTQAASTTQYFHMIAETALSVAGGSANQLDTSLIEVDGIVATRLFLDSNDITDSVAQPDPFAFFVDLHYQSSGIPTLNRSPSFYGP